MALVAASSRGLGRAIAEELAREGASLVICARGPDALEATREALERSGAELLAVPADVSVEADLDRLVSAAYDRFGRVDVVVTNAGGPPSGRFDDLPWSAWEDAVAMTLRGTVELVRRVLPGMRERKWGRVLNVTSIAAKQPVSGLMLSNSLRAAVTGFARTLADEEARNGITVNNILPGYTRTERVEQLATRTAERQGVSVDEALKGWESEIPMGRLGEPREFAALAAFLASERASYITGQSIAVDGGWIRALH